MKPTKDVGLIFILLLFLFLGTIPCPSNFNATSHERTYTSSQITPGIEILTGRASTKGVTVWEYIDSSWTRDQDSSISTPGFVTDILIEDIDGDGFQEILVAQTDGIIQIFETEDGDLVLKHNLTHPGGFGIVEDFVVGDLDNDGDENLEIMSCLNLGDTITVWKLGDITYEPIFNLSLSGYPWAIAAGNLDADSDIELVVSTGGCPGYGQVMIYEYTGTTWEQSAAYNDFEETGWALQCLHTLDIDNDNEDEIVVAYGIEPFQILEYTGSGLNRVWKSEFDPLGMYSIAVGDVTNDGSPDIILASGGLEEDTILIYEITSEGVRSTFNISEPGLPISYTNAVVVADVDGDEINEFVIVGEAGGDDLYMRIFRNDSLIDKVYTTYRWSYAVAVGDYDNDFGVEHETTTTDTETTDLPTNTTALYPIPMEWLLLGGGISVALLLIALVILKRR